MVSILLLGPQDSGAPDPPDAETPGQLLSFFLHSFSEDSQEGQEEAQDAKKDEVTEKVVEVEDEVTGEVVEVEDEVTEEVVEVGEFLRQTNHLELYRSLAKLASAEPREEGGSVQTSVRSGEASVRSGEASVRSGEASVRSGETNIEELGETSLSSGESFPLSSHQGDSMMKELFSKFRKGTKEQESGVLPLDKKPDLSPASDVVEQAVEVRVG